jgi:peptide/nickel transport system ATP-binding protein
LYKLMPEDKQAQCREVDPHVRPVEGRDVACHHAEQIDLLTSATAA